MKKRGVGRPRDTDPAETRREILKAAEETFAAAGFSGATTRAVAARAGVNVATLHYHFGSKERLYLEVLDSARSFEGSPAAAGASPSARVAASVEALFDAGWERPASTRLSLLHRLAGPRAEAGADPRAAALARAIAEAGATPARTPDEAARLVLALLDGALVAVRNGSDGEAGPPPEDARRAVVAAALRLAGLG